MNNVIKVGNIIWYRPCFGMDAPKQARVEGLTLTQDRRSKYGVQYDCVSHAYVMDNKVLFHLDDGHWCYSDQIVLDRKH